MLNIRKSSINLSIIFYLSALFYPSTIYGEIITVADTVNQSLEELFTTKNTQYVIRYHHFSKDTIIIPEGCEIRFVGGHLSGIFIFNNTRLSGSVNLKGSSIGGTISNSFMDASWLCAIDGVTDDAKSINEMIQVCGNIRFPKGVYKLDSAYDCSLSIPTSFQKSVRTHIGIAKDNVTLAGEDGCIFLTEKPLISVCIFSKPYDIDKSIKNITISNIHFKVLNDGVDFHEFMHTIKVIGVNGLTINNCVFDDYWGDAICLSHYGDSPSTGERTRNMNVTISGNYIKGGAKSNCRNGISIISGQNIIVRKNCLINTSNETMPGGIDIEPNNSAYTIDNIRIENNTLEDIKGFVGAIGIVLLRDEAPAYRISIIGNRIRNCTCGISIGISTMSSTDSLIIENNYVAADTRPYKFGGGGKSKNWIIKGNRFKRFSSDVIPGNIEVSNLLYKKKR